MKRFLLFLVISTLVFLFNSTYLVIAQIPSRLPRQRGTQTLRDKFSKKTSQAKNSLRRETITSNIQDSPFGLLGVGEPIKRWQDYTDYLVDLDVYWVRMAGRQGLTWGSVQSSKGAAYDWSNFDETLKTLQEFNVNILFHFDPRGLEESSKQKPQGSRRVRAAASLPKDLDGYTKFVQAVVERYDADGIEDMPGLKKPILIWMTQHEPDHPQFWQDSPENYAKLIKVTYEAVKRASPQAKLIIAGTAGSIDGYLYKNETPPSGFKKNPVLRARDQGRDGFFIRVFKYLKEQGVKFEVQDIIMDFHWFGDSGDYAKFKDFVNYIQRLCRDFGYENLPIWVTETSTFSGQISLAKGLGQAGLSSTQSEEEQAIELLKRYVYSLVRGIKRIFWSKVESYESDDLFSNVGIVDKLGRPKLAYYTYKLIAEKLKESDLAHIETILENKDNIYVYKIIKNNKPLYIVWCDSVKKLNLPSEEGKYNITYAVTNNDGKIISYSQETKDGFLNLELTPAPLFIEKE